VLLPRVTETFLARNSLRAHQLSLIRKLNTSLTALKDSQADVAAVLPTPEPHKEPTVFAACLSIDAVLEEAKKQAVEISGISAISLLRCAISDFRKGSESRNPRTEEVFQALEGKIPWLVSDEGASFEVRTPFVFLSMVIILLMQHLLWDTLSTCPLFVPDLSPSPDATAAAPPTGDQDILYWRYAAPEPRPPTALMQSLTSLSSSIPTPSAEKHSTLQHALQAMTEFTGYVSSQMYAPYMLSMNRFAPGGHLSPAEEDVRKEIRALKGLVLNRWVSLLISLPKLR
jgi:hypothetical protein